MMTAHGVSVRPACENSRYVGSASAVSGIITAPRVALKSTFLPGKSYFANA